MGALKQPIQNEELNLKAHSGGGEDHVDYVPGKVRLRFLATIIDTIIVSAIYFPLQKVTEIFFPAPDAQSIAAKGIGTVGIFFGITMTVSLGVTFLYYVISMKKWSATPGKKLLGLKVIRLGEEKEWGVGSVILREIIGKGIGGSVFGVGYFWAIFSEKKQGWHDLIAKSVVIKEQK